MQPKGGFGRNLRNPPKSATDDLGRPGDGLRMVSRVSVGGAGRSGDGLRMVSRVSLVSRSQTLSHAGKRGRGKGRERVW